jgi:hypothetical protein
MVKDLADELLLSPNEEHAFFHYFGRYHKFLELLNPQSRVSRPLLVEITFLCLMRLYGGLGLSVLLYAASGLCGVL